MPIILSSNVISGGPFPLMEDNYLKGGYQSVADIAARDAIITASRKEGMLVYVRDTDIIYKLGSGLTNGDWVEYGITIVPGPVSAGNNPGTSVSVTGGAPTGSGLPGSVVLEGGSIVSGTLAGNLVLRGGNGSSLANDGVIKIDRTPVDNRATRLQFVADDNTTVSVKAPASVTSYTLTLPTNDGSTSQFLQTDGSGILSWSDAVTGPGSSTDNAIVTWNGTSGTVVRNNSVVLSSQTIQASSGDLVIGGTAGSTATKGVNTVRRVTSVLTSNTNLIIGSIALVDTTSGDLDFTLPDPSVSAGQSVTIINVTDTANSIYINTFSTEMINGVADNMFFTANSVGKTAVCTSDGTNWYIVLMETTGLSPETPP
jgi:hypothetical protein